MTLLHLPRTQRYRSFISFQQLMVMGLLQVRCHHFLVHLVCGNCGHPAMLLLRLGGITQQDVTSAGRDECGSIGTTVSLTFETTSA